MFVEDKEVQFSRGCKNPTPILRRAYQLFLVVYAAYFFFSSVCSVQP